MDVFVCGAVFLAVMFYLILHIRQSRRRRKAMLRDKAGVWKAVGAPEFGSNNLEDAD